jgi:histidinol-phosphatase (PHP family)
MEGFDCSRRGPVRDADKCAEYFRLLRAAIQSGLFDCMAHIDLFRKNMPNVPFVAGHWEEVADLLVAHDVGFEINTSYAMKEPGTFHPSFEVAQILVARGARKIAIGSDAHREERVGEGIDATEDVLRSLGLHEACYFGDRVPRFIAL